MATAFDGAGMGMFGREGQFSRGGPVNELVKLLPAAGLAYGLIKSGAVSKANMGGFFSNPTKALGNAITGSAPAPSDSTVSPIQPTSLTSPSGNTMGTDIEANQKALEQGAANVKSYQFGGPAPAEQMQPASDPNKDVDSVFKTSMTDSGVTANPLNNAAQQADSNSVLQAAYTPVAPPNNQQQQSGGRGGGSALKTIFSLAKLFAAPVPL